MDQNIKESDECKEQEESCSCLQLFDIFYGLFIVFLFFHMVARYKLGCNLKIDQQTSRSRLKKYSRLANIVFGVKLVGLATITLQYRFNVEECHEQNF